VYKVNDVELWKSEYEMLQSMVDAVRDGRDPASVLDPKGCDCNYETDQYKLLLGLARHGLVEADCLESNVIEFQYVTIKGFDFIEGYEEDCANEKKRTVEQRKHDYKVAIVCGTMALFSGTLGGAFIPDLIRSAIAAISA